MKPLEDESHVARIQRRFRWEAEVTSVPLIVTVPTLVRPAGPGSATASTCLPHSYR